MANVAKAKKIVEAAIPLIAAYEGDTPPAQMALGGGGAIMTSREAIPDARLFALWPLLGKYFPEKRSFLSKDLQSGTCAKVPYICPVRP